MSISISNVARRSVAGAVSAALLLGVVAAPAQAGTPDGLHRLAVAAAPAELSSEVADTLFVLLAVPVIGSSILSSMIGIEQCGLHDTRAC